MFTNKAVIPAAGLGTRFLPATKAQPKEMIPIVDKPAIQYVVEEAVAAGLTDVLIVTGRNKRALEDHFDRAFELEAELARTGKTELLQQVQAITTLAHVHFVRQGQALGLGHAVGHAHHHIGDNFFAVLLGDDIVVHDNHLLARMITTSERHETSVVAVQEVSDDDLDRYGIVDAVADPNDPESLIVRDLAEKPGKAKARSHLGIIGRYVLSPSIFDYIAATKPGRGGEIQLTDALNAQAHDAPMRAIRFTGRRYDVGAKADALRASVELAASRADLGAEFKSFLRDFVAAMNDETL
ncbi:UTP--glucose-1-phosphate uridylyltransferase GalU [Stomatohabitans albus]|uniref:UTP--glucose-1-phosphate uridylyltransferase GalU n=1 Tax=Stomatohabitans albus TaxID=3110766 RepID=UPI00300D650C